MPELTAPPFDPELHAALGLIAEVIKPTLTPDMIPLMREMPADPTLDDQVAAVGAVHEERTIAGYDGGEIVLSIYRRPGQTTTGPGIYHIHGGGMVIGNRFMGVQAFLPYIASHDAVVVSVEYRLAPEFPDPVPVEDCYAGLVWTAEHADELGIDPTRLIVGGASAGGGLSAGVTLLARDRQGPPLRASLLIYPMLDDRNESVSALQIQGIGVWDRTSNFTGWNALLGDRRGTDDVSIYAAPGRPDARRVRDVLVPEHLGAADVDEGGWQIREVFGAAGSGVDRHVVGAAAVAEQGVPAGEVARAVPHADALDLQRRHRLVAVVEHRVDEQRGPQGRALAVAGEQRHAGR